MSQETIKGARIVLETLHRLGVTDMFGYPGGAVIPIFDEIYSFPEIKHYFVRHEQGAAHAADAYARVSGKVGVCLATSGPGATNLVTGLYGLRSNDCYYWPSRADVDWQGFLPRSGYPRNYDAYH